MKNCNDIIHYEIYFNSTNKSYGWGCIKIKKKKKNYISNNSERRENIGEHEGTKQNKFCPIIPCGLAIKIYE